MMTPTENWQLDAKIVQIDRAKASAGYKFQTVAEMSAVPIAKDWLIKGVFARGESSAWFAPPGGMKSALLAEAAICVAAALDWHTFRNKGAVGVVYFALERADLVRRRLLAVEPKKFVEVRIMVFHDGQSLEETPAVFLNTEGLFGVARP